MKERKYDPASACAVCRRSSARYCADCATALRQPQCACCQKAMPGAREPYPICPECEAVVEEEAARMMAKLDW